jgi:hypothetical protein
MEIEHTRVPKRIRILCIAISIHISIASDVDEMPCIMPRLLIRLHSKQPSHPEMDRIIQ